MGGLPLLSPAGEVLAADRDSTLVVYFSRSGNTRKVAQLIHSQVGGDLVELKTLQPYPEDYDACVDQAKKEQEQQARPELATQIADMDRYRTIFVGYPNWWGTMPMALFTFFEKYDFSGKTIAPFCTHGGSRMGRSEDDIRRLCPKARVLRGLAVRGRSAASAGKDVEAWLGSIVF
ncbi:MAG TPA: NAD(P)H-dependent oxidoreductase [Candidatus Desulfovibrio intestinipullorum]|uniref:NAD(P)H-dependent oxidoreductase n=1 Tax=Candidatus Desulfovibrio intestinipullorum TaxID=2838536 RepID=A0A9D1TNI3_9BACT|nr:NAD(P)H-dependent oxidoreductase [Candidatus Desulfovibrio intestinipullorum]